MFSLQRGTGGGGGSSEILPNIVDWLNQAVDFFDSILEFDSWQYIRNEFQAIKLLKAPFGTPSRRVYRGGVNESRRAGKQRTTSNEQRHTGQVLIILTSHCNRAFVATKRFLLFTKRPKEITNRKEVVR